MLDLNLEILALNLQLVIGALQPAYLIGLLIHLTNTNDTMTQQNRELQLIATVNSAMLFFN